MGRVGKEFRKQEFSSCRGQEFRITILCVHSNGLDVYANRKACASFAG
jgi:hypothetical protein